MITNLSLGSNGRLGNQMFQYAMLLGIKHKHGFDIMLDERIDEKSIYGYLELLKCFSLKECHFFNEKDIHVPHRYDEERFHFDPRFFKKIVDGTNFHGYFQSEKYFEHCKDAIQKEFTFRESIIQQATEFLAPYQDKHLVSVHVRRGDYVNLPNQHPVCSIDYYTEAMKQFPNDVQYVCVSDDIAWCKEHLPMKNIVFSENSTPVDLCIISLCQDNIIANSSFSWWGAWLNANANKKVIAPALWFGPFYSHYDTSDLYCPGWIQL